jgi:hypothetical protein
MIDRNPIDNGSAYTSPLDLKRFAYGQDPASRADAYAKCQAHIQTTIDRREKLAGRRLTDRELFHGIAHVDSRAPEIRAKDNAWRFTPTPTDATPISPMDDDRFKATPQAESKKSFYQRMDSAYQTRMAGVPAMEAKRQQAISFSQAALESVLFDSTASQAEVDAARRLTVQAEKGCLDTFKTMADSWADERAAVKSERISALNIEIAQREEEKLRYHPEPEPVEAKPEPKPAGERPTWYPESRLKSASDAERAKMEASNAAYSEWKAEREASQ